jgi:hypothetical protein
MHNPSMKTSIDAVVQKYLDTNRAFTSSFPFCHHNGAVVFFGRMERYSLEMPTLRQSAQQ